MSHEADQEGGEDIRLDEPLWRYCDALLHNDAALLQGTAAVHLQQLIHLDAAVLHPCRHNSRAILDEFDRLARDSGKYAAMMDFLRHLCSEAGVSDRTFAAAVRLLNRYLSRSIDVNAAQTPHMTLGLQRDTSFNITKVILECAAIAMALLDGVEPSMPPSVDYRCHVLTMLDYDVAESSPLDFIAALEEIDPQCAPFASEAIQKLGDWILGVEGLGAHSSGFLALGAILVTLQSAPDWQRSAEEYARRFTASAGDSERATFLREVMGLAY
jgi:hypothetical protein